MFLVMPSFSSFHRNLPSEERAAHFRQDNSRAIDDWGGLCSFSLSAVALCRKSKAILAARKLMQLRGLGKIYCRALDPSEQCFFLNAFHREGSGRLPSSASTSAKPLRRHLWRNYSPRRLPLHSAKPPRSLCEALM